MCTKNRNNTIVIVKSRKYIKVNINKIDKIANLRQKKTFKIRK